MHRPHIAAGLLVALVLVPAEVRAASPRTACRGDAERLCPEALAARDRTAIRACILRNADRLSQPCRQALLETRAAGRGGG